MLDGGWGTVLLEDRSRVVVLGEGFENLMDCLCTSSLADINAFISLTLLPKASTLSSRSSLDVFTERFDRAASRPSKRSLRSSLVVVASLFGFWPM